MYINPYEQVCKGHGNWLRSNFHIHAGTGPNTCGELGIDEVVYTYQRAGYDVLMISNHDVFTDASSFEDKYGITLINGYEFSKDINAGNTSKYWHMLCLDSKKVYEGKHQDIINQCHDDEGITILCHPNWVLQQSWPVKLMKELKGYMGIEIRNGVIDRLSGSGTATDVWDILLSDGRLVWGFGHDDFHRWFDLAKAWNMIYSEDASHASVKAALRYGSFYVSTGLELDLYKIEDNILTAKVKYKSSYVNNFDYIFYGQNGRKLSEQHGDHCEFMLDGNEAYVRMQAIGENGAMLWTQPVYKKDRFNIAF